MGIPDPRLEAKLAASRVGRLTRLRADLTSHKPTGRQLTRALLSVDLHSRSAHGLRKACARPAAEI
jgi:hypothetical protein